MAETTDPCAPDLSSCDLIVGFAAAYDKASNRLYERHLHSECRSYTYTHDEADRLTRYQRGKLEAATDPVTAPTVSHALELVGATADFTYDLDGVGNWDGATTIDGGETTSTTESRTHNAMNQVTQAGAQSGFTYDGNGNLTSDGTLTYKYDAFNRLKEVWQSGQKVASYAYDAMGRRVKRVVENLAGTGQTPAGGVDHNVTPGTTFFFYAGERCVEERDETGTVRRQYVWGQYIDELVEQREDDGEKLYPLSDLTWRTVALTNQCGCVVEAYDADAYGRMLVFPNAGGDETWFTDDDLRLGGTGNDVPFAPRCRYLFTGREFDAETSLHYYRARTYDPKLGRFLQRDPLGYDAGDANLYAYCHGNPLVHTDPDGEFLANIVGAVVGAVHGAISVYINNPNASWGSILLGGALGGVFGAINPAGAIASAVGAAVGSEIAYRSGGSSSLGFNIGGLVGGLGGGFANGVKAGLQSLAWEGGGAAIGGGIGYAIGGDAQSAFLGATLGMFAGGIGNAGYNLINGGASALMSQGGVLRSPSSIQRGLYDSGRVGWLQQWKYWWQYRGLISQLKRHSTEGLSLNTIGVSHTKEAVFGLMGKLQAATGREVGLLRMNRGRNGLVLRLGKWREVSSKGAARVLAHTHESKLGWSGSDIVEIFMKRGQRSSISIGETGRWRRLSSNEAILGGNT